MDIGDIDSPQDFENKDLKGIDELVRCPICCDIMTTATLITKCLHNFCSICIRRHVESKKQCPICKEGCSEVSLVTNKIINEITDHYKRLRDGLVDLDKRLSGGSTNPTPTLHTPTLHPTPEASNSSTPCNTSRGDATPHDTSGTPQNTSLNQSSLSKLFKVKKRTLGEVKTLGEASCYQSVSASTSRAPSSVDQGPKECPVCKALVPGHKINYHLDMCLKRTEREEMQVRRPVKKKLPIRVWTMMTDKALRELCRKYKLTSSGKKPELVKRLKEYTLRYNSQIEHTKQKSDKQLVHEVEQAEKVQLTSPPSVIINLKSDADRAAYSNKYEGQFVKLINAARKTRDTGSRKQEPPPEEDELQITHEVQSTPKKKCNGSLLNFFKSPNKSSSPVEAPSPSSLISLVRCPASQDVNMVTPPRSSKHPGCSSGQYNSDEIFSFPTQSPRSIPTQSPKVISSSAHSFKDIPSSITAVSPALRGAVASPAPSLSIISPVPSGKSPRSAVKPLFTTPIKQTTGSFFTTPVKETTRALFTTPVKETTRALFKTAEEEAAGDSDDLFGDDEELENLDFDEIERSMTQRPKSSSDPIDKPNLSDSTLGPDIDFSPETPTSNVCSRDVTTKRRDHPSKGRDGVASKRNAVTWKGRDGSSKVKPSSHILGAVLGAEEDASLEEEVSRLYSVQDENSLNSLNTSRISKLDRLLEKSYRSKPAPRPAPFDDSMADLLDNLDKSPTEAVMEVGRARTMGAAEFKIESPPRNIPIIDEEDLPDFSLEDLPCSPIINVRNGKRSSDSPFDGHPKRGRLA